MLKKVDFNNLVETTLGLCNIRSESLEEKEITDVLEQRLIDLLDRRGWNQDLLVRFKNTLYIETPKVATKNAIMIGGHLDTVPINDNFPCGVKDDYIFGIGTCDMKSSLAIMLKLLENWQEGWAPISCLFYSAEEIDIMYNELPQFLAENQDIVDKTRAAILGEPTSNQMEVGCQGVMEVSVDISGEASHSARTWRSVDANYYAARISSAIGKLNSKQRVALVEDLEFRPQYSIVYISGGSLESTNVVVNNSKVLISSRVEPGLSKDEAFNRIKFLVEAVVQKVYDEDLESRSAEHSTVKGLEPNLNKPKVLIEIKQWAPSGYPANHDEVISKFGEVIKEFNPDFEIYPKLGWTDVATMTSYGIPAINFGPGDPIYAHQQGEKVSIEKLEENYVVLERFLSNNFES